MEYWLKIGVIFSIFKFTFLLPLNPMALYAENNKSNKDTNMTFFFLIKNSKKIEIVKESTSAIGRKRTNE